MLGSDQESAEKWRSPMNTQEPDALRGLKGKEHAIGKGQSAGGWGGGYSMVVQRCYTVACMLLSR